MLTRFSFIRILLFGLLLWLSASIAIFGLAIWQQYSIAKITNRLYTHPFVANNAARDIRVYSRTAWEYATKIVYHRGLNQESLDKIKEFEDKTEKTFILLRKTYLGKATDIDEIYNNYEKLKKTYHTSVTMVQNGQTNNAGKHLEKNKALAIYYALSDDVNDVIKTTHNRAKIYINDALSYVHHGMWILAGSAITLLLITILSANTVFKYIRKEFITIKEFASKVELGAFINIPLDADDKNEFGDLKRTLNTMSSGLSQSRDQLVQSEKMASLGSLVAGVSHEINTPVGIGLTGVTHLQKLIKELKIKYDNSEMGEDDFNEFLEQAIELGRSIELNLNRAADHVRSFKQVAVDQTSEVKRTFRLKEYIEEILVSLRNKTKKTRIKFTIDIDEGLQISSYPGAFSQIITNLVINSLVHAFTPGAIGNIIIRARNKDTHLVLHYQDDGKGIEKHILQKIFDPFFTTNREQGGSGLGLNIAHNLVTQRLKGTIICNSTAGKGVEFIIAIPLNEDP